LRASLEHGRAPVYFKHGCSVFGRTNLQNSGARRRENAELCL
jgi:hypothetical protein